MSSSESEESEDTVIVKLKDRIEFLKNESKTDLDSMQILDLLNEFGESFELDWFVQEESVNYIWFNGRHLDIMYGINNDLFFIDPELLVLLQELIYEADKTIQRIRYKNGGFFCFRNIHDNFFLF